MIKDSLYFIFFFLIVAISIKAKAQAIPQNFDVSNLNGTNGFNISFEGNMELGSITNAGDINGDGIEDLVITDPSARPNNFQGNIGRAYVIFGTNNGFPSLLNLTELDGTNGFYINGFTEPFLLGTDVSGLGDINGDNFDDFIISSVMTNNGNSADFGAYVIFGKSNFPKELDPALLDGTNGFKIKTSSFPQTSPSVSFAGDINGDGLNDILLGDTSALAFPGTNLPKAYIVFGNSSFTSVTDALTLNGSNGFIFEGDIDFTGSEISGGGDINNDDFDDIIIGSINTNYIIYGKSTSFNAKITPNDIDGTNGFTISPPQATTFSSISFLKDINNDELNDMALGIALADPNGRNNAGQTVIIFGKSGGFGASFDLNTLDGSSGFVINGVSSGDNFGFDVTNINDFNGDGISDVMIYADGVNSQTPERSYIVYGRNDNFPSFFEASSLDGSNGFALNAGVRLIGGAFTSLDINNDGLSDIASVSFINLSSVIFGTNATTPYFTSVIGNQSTTENGSEIVIDLNDKVTDDDSDDNLITFEVTSNTNSSLVSTSIVNNVLTIKPLQDQIGKTDITITATSDGLKVRNRFTVSVIEVPLYEQIGFSNTNNSHISQIFTDLGGAVESADNFTIPDGETWTLERVTVDALYIGNKPENGVVIIYEDDNGNVGNKIYTSTDISIMTTEIPVRFSLSFPSSLELQSGNYWISVQAKQNFNPGQNRWFWGYAKPAIQNDFYIQDSEKLLGATSPTTYNNSGRDGALVFSLYGEKTGTSLGASEEKISNIFIYPNPFQNQLNIELPDGFLIESISIFDMQGKDVFKTKTFNKTLHLKSLQTGVYILKLKTESETATFKIVKS